jgi:hypothetical protein
MKKILALVALIAVFSFVACNDDDYDFNTDGYPAYIQEPVYCPTFHDILGTYRDIDTVNFQTYCTLRADSTYSCSVYSFDSLIIQENGKFLYEREFPTNCYANLIFLNSSVLKNAATGSDTMFEASNSLFIKIR